MEQKPVTRYVRLSSPMTLPYNRDHKPRARDLRRGMPPAEQVVWHRLRRKQLHGVQFYRQKPLHQYIVDFYCPRAQLVIELDGVQHSDPDHREADQLRDRVLGQLGLQVLRFTNDQVMDDVDGVVGEIGRVVLERVGGS